MFCQECSTSVWEHRSFHMQFFFQSCSNMWWMTCFWWQLAHNIAIHIIRLSLKKGCSEVNVEKITTFTGCHLATHPKSRSCRSRRTCLLDFAPIFWPIKHFLLLEDREGQTSSIQQGLDGYLLVAELQGEFSWPNFKFLH